MSTEAGTASARVIARGAGAAGLAVVPAAIAHGIADGHLVAPGTLALTILAATAVCVRLVGKRAGRARIAAAVLASQLLFHGIFLLVHLGSSAAHSAATPSSHAGHDPAEASAALAGVTSVDAAVLAPDAGMILAHLCAAAVTILGILHGRSVCARLVRAGRSMLVRLARLARPAPLLPGVTRTALVPHEIPVLRAVFPCACGSRGPPAFVA